MFELIVGSVGTIVGALIGVVVPRLLDARKAKNEQAYKFVYIKLYYLKRRVQGAAPVYQRFVERLGRKVAVFDEFHMFKLNIFRGERKGLVVGDRSSGVVDMQILHPWQRVTFADLGAAKKDDVIEQVIRRPSAVYFTRSIYLNGLQEGHERLAIKMEQDTKEARIVVDFSSVPEFAEMMLRGPSAVIRRDDYEESLAVGETDVGGIYEVGTRLLRQGDVLRVDFHIDWEHPSLNDCRREKE